VDIYGESRTRNIVGYVSVIGAAIADTCRNGIQYNPRNKAWFGFGTGEA
jgi:hypothetical protein